MQAFLTFIQLGMKPYARTRLLGAPTTHGGLLFDKDFDGFVVNLGSEKAGRGRYQRRQVALVDSPGHRRSRSRSPSAAWGVT